MRQGHPHRLVIASAVDIDVSPHGIDRAQAVASRLLTAQPQDATQDPVTPGVLSGELRRPVLAGRAATTKHRAIRQAVADAGATSPKDMGKVVALVKPQVAGRADMGQVSTLVKQKLGG